MLVAFRLAGVFMLTPILSAAMIPQRVKVLLVLALSAAVYPTVPIQTMQAAPPESIFALLPLVTSEMLIGFIIGGLAAVPMLCMDVAGVLMGQQMGFGLARVYNPEFDADTDILGQLLFFIATGTFLAFGGLEILLTTLVKTFAVLPPGSLSFRATPIDTYVGLLGVGVELAIRCALPVTATILLLIIVFGVIGKTMPQINIMTVGFTAKILAGIAVLAFALPHISGAIGQVLADTATVVDDWALSVAPQSLPR